MKFFRLSVLAIFFFFSSRSIAQIGINTITPDSSASLHILSKPGGSGLIIPELTEAQRLAIPKPAVGLMVYDLTAKLFYMNMETTAGNNWYAINPWLTQGSNSTPGVLVTSPVVTKVGIGIQSPQTPQATLDVNGDIKASTAVATPSLNVTGFATNALVPTGGIIMWSGDPTAVPTGWALCNGQTIGTFLTPNLSGRFIVGFDSNSPSNPTNAPNDGKTTNYGAVANTGGETGHILTKAELPKHQHAIGNNIDNGTFSSNGEHQHSCALRKLKAGGKELVWSQGWEDGTQYTDWAGLHSHEGKTGDGTTDELANAVHENRPPYYVLAYIIKLP